MKSPPVAERRPFSYRMHGVTIEDPYHWLKDDKYPKVEDEDVLAYLNAENEYFASVMQPLAEDVEQIFQEMKARKDEHEHSVPVRRGAWLYQTRYFTAAQYPTYVRWSASTTDPQDEDIEVLLDLPSMAESFDYFQLGSFSVSHNGHLLAYSTDTNGSERYTLVVKDLRTGELLEEEIHNTIGSAVWSADDESFFYSVVNEEWRPDRIFRHVVGQPGSDDVLVFHETDSSFFVDVSHTSSREFVVIETSQHTSSEAWIIPSSRPDADPQLIAKRSEDHLYSVDHASGRFVILTNDTIKNFSVVEAPESDPSRENWTSLVDGSNDRFLTGLDCFNDFVIVELRERGLDQILVIENNDERHQVEFDEPVFTVGLGDNPNVDASFVRLGYESLTTPSTVFDYDVGTRRLTTRKVQKIPSGYDKSQYVSQRHMVRARDGAEVPVSIVYRRTTPLDGTAPLYLYGYGAYGYSMSPDFSTSRLSLLDRGFVYAIAHIRGGSELGWQWYEDGKLDKRTNTFNDFVDVARFLVSNNFARAGNIAISGGSAGGELMGAVTNQAPDLWGVVAAHVPFVDVLNTMLDESLPLTPMEWPEWGNPIEDQEAFDYIRSYSPYDQLSEGSFPAMFVTGGLNDPRVTYWEPAKYVAKLRTLNTGDRTIVLRTEMGAGHGGKSGRFNRLRDTAEEYAFVISSLQHVQ